MRPLIAGAGSAVRKGVIVSAVLHAGIITATLVSWPSALDLSIEEIPPTIPIELVTIAKENNVEAAVVEPEPIPEEVPAEPAPEIVAEASVPEPPPAEVAPEPEPKAEPEPAPKPPVVSRAPENPAIPRPRPQPQPQARPQPAQNFDLDSVIALLDNREPRAPAPASAPVAERANAGIGARNAMTMDIETNLKAQIRECWNLPVGAPRPEELIVQVRVLLARNGEPIQTSLTPESLAKARGNPYMNSAGEAAIRAVNVCAPYENLPADRYESWRELIMTFDPKELAGR